MIISGSTSTYMILTCHRAGNAGWDTQTFSEQLDHCAPDSRLLLQTTVVEQDGGKGPYASVPISAFSTWLQHIERSKDAADTGRSGQSAPSPPSPTPVAYYLSEMDDIDELCPALLPDLSFLRPFDAILPWGSFVPWPVSELIATLTGGWDIADWSGLYAPMYPVLWWGPEGTRTGLHYDIERYNILAQIRGSKNVVRAVSCADCLLTIPLSSNDHCLHLMYGASQTFFQPGQDDRLYPNDVWDRSAVISSVNMWDSDATAYPRFREAVQ